MVIRALALFFAFQIILFPQLKGESFRIQNGVLDLRSASFNQAKPIKIEGEVEFYWKKLIDPNTFADSNFLEKPQMVAIPKSWTTYRIGNEKLPAEGFATYRFTILCSPNGKFGLYGIRVPSVFSSYRLWANGELINGVGRVGSNANEHKPQFKHENLPILIDSHSSTQIEIVIQVSNYSHRRAGLFWPLYFGSLESLSNSSRMSDIINLIIIGLILIIGLNHMNMYIFRRKDRSNLYFGLVCLAMIIRNITTGDRVLGFILPEMSWDLLVKLDNFSGFGTIPFFALFIYNLYKEDFPKWIRDTLVGIGAAIALFVFVTPPMLFGKFRLVFEIYTLIGGLYLTFGVLLPASIKRRPSAIIAFLGLFILYATAVNDVLSSMGIIQTAYIAHYGLAIFMLMQSVSITSKSAIAINSNEDLSHQLELEKHGLEEKIEERTRELTLQHNELIAHQEKEQVRTWVNSGLNQISKVLSSHKNDFKLLSRNVLSALVKHVHARMGALYILNEDDPYDQHLELVADYGCNKKMTEVRKRIEIGEGLVGTVFLENDSKVIVNIPDDFFKISSGMGDAKPTVLLLVPLTFDDKVYGVVELASFREFKQHEKDFIQGAASNIATNLHSVRMNEQNLKLIKQFTEQAQDMSEKEESMRRNLEELEYYREQYERLSHGKTDRIEQRDEITEVKPKRGRKKPS